MGIARRDQHIARFYHIAIRRNANRSPRQCAQLISKKSHEGRRQMLRNQDRRIERRGQIGKKCCERMKATRRCPDGKTCDCRIGRLPQQLRHRCCRKCCRVCFAEPQHFIDKHRAKLSTECIDVRLCQGIGGAKRERFDCRACAIACQCRNDDNAGTAAGLNEFWQRSKTVQSGHLDVQKNDVDVRTAKPVNRAARTVQCCNHFKGRRSRNHARQRRPRNRRIINDQNTDQCSVGLARGIAAGNI